MKHLVFALVGLGLLVSGARAQSKPHPITAKQLQKAQAAYRHRVQQAQRNALLAQARALKAQQARARKATTAHYRVKPAPRPPQTVIVQNITIQQPKASPTPTPIPTTRGIITTLDLAAKTMAVKRENVETTYAVRDNTTIRINGIEGKELKDLTKDLEVEVTSADGKRADTISAHDKPKLPGDN